MQSMTGFGRAEITAPIGTLVLELSSVNRKYLEIITTLPKELNSFEIFVKKLMQKELGRGQITARYFFSLSSFQEAMPLDKNTLEGMKNRWQHLAKSLGFSEKEITLSFLLEQMEKSGWHISYQGEDWAKTVEDLTKKALKALVKMRKEEGKSLQKDFLQRLSTIEGFLGKIEGLAPSVEADLQQKMQEKIDSFSHLHDHEERVYRELAIQLEKLDVSEEITRLWSHFSMIKKSLSSQDASLGKEVGFLELDMLREIHTLSVKSSNIDLTKFALYIISELEKI